MPSPARPTLLRGRRVLAAALAQGALLAFLAACADSPTTPAASGSTPLFGTALSRTHPVAGPMSMHAPSGDLPIGSAGPSVLAGRPAGAPLVRDASSLFDLGNIALPGGGGTSANALVTGAHLVWQNTSSGERSIWTMTGATWGGSFTLLPTVSTAWSIAAAADLSGDGQPDLVWQNLTTGERSIWIMNGTTYSGNFVLLPTVSANWRIVGAGDFNGDSKPDLVWQDGTNGDRSIWFMNGTTWGGQFALLPNEPPTWSIAAVEDFTGDNKPDLVWQNSVTGQRSIWFMNGATWTGGYSLLQTVPVQWNIATAGDFNADGNADLVWENTSTGERSIWLMTGATWGGAFSALQTVSTPWRIAAAGNFVGSAAPGRPTGLQPAVAVSSSASQITLNWAPGNPDNETSTQIERATWTQSQTQNPIPFTQVGTVGANVTTFTDNGLPAASKFVYRIRACNASGCSQYLGNVNADTGPVGFTDLATNTPVNGQGAPRGVSNWYRFTIPAGRTSLSIQTSGGTGDEDLYVWLNGVNGTSVCASANHTAGSANNETCNLTNPPAGTYYIQLFGDRSSYASVTIVANSN